MNPPSSMVIPSAASTMPARLSEWLRWFFSLENRYLVPLFITGILAVAQLSYGVLESYSRTLLAIFTALVVESVVGRLFWGKWPNLASSYVTGISVGILLRSPAMWPYALCSALSVISKYVLRIDGRHLWNPSNFGICALLVLASDTVSSLSIQWGNYLPPMLVVWTLGALIIWQAKRFHICATYVLSFLFFAYVRSHITGHAFLAEVAPITGPMYQLFIFFMITDPKTTVGPKWGQCVVTFLVALVEMFLRLNESIYAPLYALCLVGPSANVIEIWWTSRQPATTPSPKVA